MLYNSKMKMSRFAKKLCVVLMLCFAADFSAAVENVFTLDSYINLYLNNSTSIAEEYNSFEAARLEFKNKVINLFLPSAGFNAGTELFSKDNPGFGFSNPYDAGVYIDWNIFNFGRDYLTFVRQKNIFEIARLRYENKLQDSTLDAIKAFYDLKLKESLLEVARHDLEEQKEQSEMTRNLYLDSLRAYSDLLQSENNYKNSQLRFARAQATYTSSKNTFNNNIGRSIDAAVILDYELPPPPPLFTSSYSEDFELAVRNREDINSSILRLHNSKITQKLATLENLPMLDASFSFTNSSSDIFGNTSNSTNYALGLNLNVPIGFFWLDKYNDVRISKLALLNSFMDFEDLARTVRTLVSNVRTEIELQYAGMDISENNLKIAQERFDIIRNKFKDGRAGSLELSSAQDEFLNAQINDTTYKYEYQLNQYSYRRTLGMEVYDLSAVVLDVDKFQAGTLRSIEQNFLRKR